MLLNTQKVDPTVIEQLEASCFNFYLTGSRFFGTGRDGSDWDFFVQNESQVINYLKKLGFERIIDEDYQDRSIVEVFHHQTGVDVQVVRNADLKNKAQNILTVYPIHERSFTSEHWNRAFNVAQRQ